MEWSNEFDIFKFHFSITFNGFIILFSAYIQSKGYCHVGSLLAPFSQRHRRLVISVDIYPLHIVKEQVCALMKKTL